MLPNVECIPFIRSILYASRWSLPSMCAYLLPCRGLPAIILYFRYTLFMQNKPNLRNDVMSVNLYNTEDYEENGHSGHQKTKPIQTQFKPNLSQNKPNLTQFQSQTNPISNDINGLDNNLPNCYISLLNFMLKNVKIGKRIIQ